MESTTARMLMLVLRRRDRAPAWLGQLLGVLAVLLILVLLLTQRRQAAQRESDERELEAGRFRRRAGQRFIHLAGRERSGKSAVGNALLGTDFFAAERGAAASAEYRPPWWIRELSPAALRIGDAAVLRRHIRPGDLVLHIIDEQPFRADRQFLELMDSQFHTTRVLVVVNKADLLSGQYTAEEITSIKESVREELGGFLRSEEDIVWAAGAPQGEPQVDELRARLDQVLDEYGK